MGCSCRRFRVWSWRKISVTVSSLTGRKMCIRDRAPGAVDHIAINVKDIEEAFRFVNEAGLNNTNDIIHSLPFFENGVKFFTIEGANKEKVEFNQFL